MCMAIYVPPDAQQPHFNPVVDSAFESLLQIPLVRDSLVIVAMGVTLLLLVRIWSVHRDRSVLGKIGWSLVVCLPLVGWVLYWGLATVPTPHRDRPQHWESDGLG